MATPFWVHAYVNACRTSPLCSVQHKLNRSNVAWRAYCAMSSTAETRRERLAKLKALRDAQNAEGASLNAQRLHARCSCFWHSPVPSRGCFRHPPLRG